MADRPAGSSLCAAALAFASVVYLLVPERGPAHVVLTFGVVGGALTIVGRRARRRDADGAVWRWVLLFLVLQAAGGATWLVQGARHDEPFGTPSPANIVFLLSYVALILGVRELVRRTSGTVRSWSAAVDVAIVTTGLATPMWVFVVTPALDSGAPLATTLMALAHPILQMAALAAGVGLVLLGQHPASAGRRILAALGIMVSVGVAHNVSLTNDVHIPTTVLGLGWLLAFGIVAEATRHPVQIGSDRSRPATTGAPLRATVLAAPLLLTTLVGVATAHRDLRDLVAVSAGGIIVIALFAARTAIGIDRAERQARRLAENQLHLRQTVDDLRRTERHLFHQATHDDLTGLPSRRFVQMALERSATGDADRRDGRTLVLLDLDGFRHVNDTWGHDAGDRLLVHVAARLAATARPTDIVARLGGDEFALVLGETDPDAARAQAERAFGSLRLPFVLDGRSMCVRASGGIVVDPRAELTSGEMLRRADLAMYAAKQAGGTRCELFVDTMNKQSAERLEIEAELRLALERDEIVAYYQPVVELASGSISGFEALVRWQHPRRGLLAPAAFLSVAEESGLIVPMGRAVLTAALRQVGVWQARHPTTPPLNVAVNLSARQLDDPHLVDEVAAALHGSDTLPGSLVLEITETDTMRHFDGAVESLTSLRRLGVRIAIDDFGTGFSSLSYLARLPIDILKIDKAFTDHITAANASSRVAVSICRLGHSLDLEIVAEGVESGEQVTALQAQGCQLAQGYHFSVPLPAAAVDAMLSASSSFPVSAPPEASSLSTRGDRDATEGRFIVPWPYAALIRHSAEMVLLVDADGAIRYANDAASAFFKGSDFVGLDTFFDRIHPDDLERARAIYGRRTRTRGVGERRHRFRLSHAELGWRTIEATADNLVDDPAVGGIVVNACDVTDQVRAERVLHGLGETVVDGAGVGTDSH